MQLRAAANERLGCQLALAGESDAEILLSLPMLRSR
jgi:hypothetical protein